MANSQIIYNGTTIAFGVAPQELSIDPKIARTVSTTVAGLDSVTYLPRIDVYVSAVYETLCDAVLSSKGVSASTLRLQLENWWHWAQRGGIWDYAVDSTKKVRTFLASEQFETETVIEVNSVAGIQTGSRYVLVDGVNYQMVTVTNISGLSLTVSPALDYHFAASSRFRDAYYWSGQIRDPEQDNPIIDADVNDAVVTGFPINQFDFRLRFVEAP